MQGQQQLLPFRRNTRQRKARVGTLTYSSQSNLTQLEVPRVGLLSAINIFFRGTVTYSAAGTVADRGPWQLLNRIQVNLNQGSQSLVDVSGYGAYLIQPQLRTAFSPDKAGIGDTTPSSDVYVFPVSGSSQSLNLSWRIPIALNDGSEFDLGLINLQAPEVRCTVNLTTGPTSDICSNISALTGTFYIEYEYFEFPNPQLVALPPAVIHRIIEDSIPVAGTGDTIYEIPRLGSALSLTHVVRLNGARSDSIDALSLKINKTDTIYTTDRWSARLDQRYKFARTFPTGVYVWDWFSAMGLPFSGDFRDAFDTEAVTTTESIITVSSSATLGSNNNFIDNIRRVMQLLTY